VDETRSARAGLIAQLANMYPNPESVPHPAALDRRLVRRAFERAAVTCDAAAVVQREVGARMAERLALVRLAPASILDAGCGTGEALGELSTRYPGAQLTGIDFALAMARAARERTTAAAVDRRSLLARMIGARVTPPSPHVVCGALEALPLKPGSIDLVWSNLALQWIDAPQQAFAEFHRVLRVGGLLTFTTLGPDTLRELRAAFAGIDGATHINRFFDMHDIGDMLVDSGFADPVMDMEMLTLTYADARAPMRELKALGAHNATAGRPRGLMGRSRWARMQGALERHRRDGLLPVTIEVVYGHAWKPEPRLALDGRAIVRFGSPPPR
jgi:malonyl-CoA O-methyltransferase